MIPMENDLFLASSKTCIGASCLMKFLVKQPYPEGFDECRNFLIPGIASRYVAILKSPSVSSVIVIGSGTGRGNGLATESDSGKSRGYISRKSCCPMSTDSSPI